MQNIYFVCCLLFCGNSLFSQAQFDKDTIHSKPNIVLILVDDAALMDFGVYGGEAYTPHIDQLANNGTIFTHYRSSLMCAPARSMLLTGYDSHLTGVPNLPLFTPPEYASKPGYEGILNNDVMTVATRLKRQGYQTYITGKWHLGHTNETLPTRRGFDRSYILDSSGADNYEHRPYLPSQSEVPWYKDGEPIDLPEDFYSSRNLVDEMIQIMDEETEVDNPFFAFISFQAIHIPVQAPKEFTEKYIDVYAKGWDVIKQKRFETAKQLGFIPEDASLAKMLDVLRKWDDLDDETKYFYAKAMAVNAGMLEAMDLHIGRYISYLKKQGKFDNTVFIITSDNGPEASSAGDIKSMQYWLKYVDYNRNVETLGEKGSFNYIGPEFASAAAGPSAFFKFYAGEGGLRVPLIFSGKGIPSHESKSAFARVTDITPTILTLAGVDKPTLAPAGPMTGRSLTPVLDGSQDFVYDEHEPLGIEAAGHAALYKGNYKLVRNGLSYGDSKWKLYDISIDPGETTDLSITKPDLFAEMNQHYTDYINEVGVLTMPEAYEPLLEIQKKMVAKIKQAAMPWIIGLLLLILDIFLWRQRKTRICVS